jgi:hypothetical protein
MELGKLLAWHHGAAGHRDRGAGGGAGLVGAARQAVGAVVGDGAVDRQGLAGAGAEDRGRARHQEQVAAGRRACEPAGAGGHKAAAERAVGDIERRPLAHKHRAAERRAAAPAKVAVAAANAAAATTIVPPPPPPPNRPPLPAPLLAPEFPPPPPPTVPVPPAVAPLPPAPPLPVSTKKV